MKRLVTTAALVAIVAATRPAPAAEPDPDPWLGTDKALHFGVSGALAIGGYAIGSALVDGEARPLLIGAAVSLTAGIAKETLDLAGVLGHPSWKDLAWDGLGTITGLAIAWSISQVIRAVSPPKEKPPIAAATLSPVIRF